MRYGVYHLAVESEIDFPEFPKASEDGAADVVISLGSVPDHLEDPIATGVLYEASAEEFLLRVPDVAAYYVNSEKIIVEPAGAPIDEVRVFLLGSAMGALLHLRGMLVLHAAAFATPQGAVLLACLLYTSPSPRDS